MTLVLASALKRPAVKAMEPLTFCYPENKTLRLQDNLRAFRLGFGVGHNVGAAVRLGFFGASNDTGVFGALKGNNSNWFTAQTRASLLFDRGEEAVEIQMKAFNLGRFSHVILFLSVRE